MKTMAQIEKVSNFSDGWCTPEKSFNIYKVIKEHKLESGLEIGVFNGKSFYPAVLAMCENGSGKMHGVDPWTDFDNTQFFLDGTQKDKPKRDWDGLYQSTVNIADKVNRLHKVDVKPFCEIHRKTSEAFHNENKDLKFDYLHIDGNHSYEKVKLDLKLHLPNLKSGGYLVMDDLAWEAVKKAFDEETTELESYYMGERDLWGIFKKK